MDDYWCFIQSFYKAVSWGIGDMKMLIKILVSLPDIQRAKHNELYQKAWSFKPGKYDAAHWRQKLIRMDTFSCAPTAGVLHAKMVNLSRRRVFQDQTDIFLCIVIVIIHYLHLCHQIEQLQRGTIVKTTRLAPCGAGIILEVNHLAI